MSFGLIWLISIIGTVIIVDKKSLHGGYIFLSLIIGPIAFILVFLAESKKKGIDDTHLNSYSDTDDQISAIKQKVAQLQIRIEQLERGSPSKEEVKKSVIEPEEVPALKPIALEKEIEPPKVIYSPPKISKVVTHDYQEPIKKKETKRNDFEMNFGQNWLNKIGIVILTLGVGFLIRHQFMSTGPLLKIALGYLVSVGMFFGGIRLEKKEELKQYGRVMIGGAWAITYFTTFAMHHFDASRIIHSQLVDLILLTIVAAGMIMHSLKYKSESMTAMALFVAYVTGTIGQITMFTFFSSLLLAGVVLFLVYRFQWINTLLLGIALSYGIHLYWVGPNILDSLGKVSYLGRGSYDSLNVLHLLFLSAYWIVFTAGIHLIKSNDNQEHSNRLAVANFSNFSLYFFLTYSLMTELFYQQRFIFTFGLGLFYLGAAALSNFYKDKRLFQSNVIVAISALTFSVSIQFLPMTTLVLWLIEIPILLFMGLTFKQTLYRYLSYLLSGVCLFRIFFEFQLMDKFEDVQILFLSFRGQEFIHLLSGIVMGVCFMLLHSYRSKMEGDDLDDVTSQLYSLFSGFFLTHFIYLITDNYWTPFVFSLEAAVLFILGLLSALSRFRYYSYALLAVVYGGFLFESHFGGDPFLSLIIISTIVLVPFALYFLAIVGQKKGLLTTNDENEPTLLFCGAALFLMTAIFNHVDEQWITLGVGLSGVFLLLIGFMQKDKIVRLGGLTFFAVTMLRIVFVDIAHLDAIYKIISFIILGVLFLGVSFIYNKFTKE